MKQEKLKFKGRSPYRPGDNISSSPITDDEGCMVHFTGIARVIDVLNGVATDTRQIVNSEVTISTDDGDGRI